MTLIVSWLVTLAFHPEQVLSHPAKPIIGSFSPSFGWDYAPSSYIAIVLCSMNGAAPPGAPLPRAPPPAAPPPAAPPH